MYSKVNVYAYIVYFILYHFVCFFPYDNQIINSSYNISAEYMKYIICTSYYQPTIIELLILKLLRNHKYFIHFFVEGENVLPRMQLILNQGLALYTDDDF